MPSRAPGPGLHALRAAVVACGVALCATGPVRGQERPAAAVQQQQTAVAQAATIAELRKQLDAANRRSARLDDELQRLREQIARAPVPPRPDDARSQVAALGEQLARARRQIAELVEANAELRSRLAAAEQRAREPRASPPQADPRAAIAAARQAERDAVARAERDQLERRRAEAALSAQLDIARGLAAELQSLRDRLQRAERDRVALREETAQGNRERSQALTSARAEVDAARAEAAAARAAADSARAAADSERVQAESARKDADEARAQAQSARNEAQTQRALAAAATTAADGARTQAAASGAELQRERERRWVWVAVAAAALLAGAAAGAFTARRLFRPVPKSVPMSASVRPGRWSFELYRARAASVPQGARADAMPNFVLRTTLWPGPSSVRPGARPLVSS